jgi:UDP-glucose:(heptosyl)LPS alpha-1,3-glucosyltransferase
MKIAVIIERFDPNAGGAERSTAQIADHLARRGHSVCVLTWWRRAEYEVAGVEIESRSTTARLGAVNLFRFARWAPKRVEQGGFDVSLSMTTAVPAAVMQPRSGTIRETLARNLAMRHSFSGRQIKRLLLACSPKQRAQLILEKKSLTDPSVKCIAAVSRYVEQQLLDHYAMDPQRIRLVPNAADMPSPDDEQRSQWRRIVRKGFEVTDQTPLFLFAAHNPWLKGCSTLLRAIRLMQQQGSPAIALMAGKVDYRVLKEAAALGVRDRIRIVGSTNRMAELYCAADVTVLPTWYDPSSKVVIESLMMGTPVITTKFNGAGDFVSGNGGGGGHLLDDPGDADALARTMLLLSDPAERAKCRPDAADLAQTLSMHRHVDQLEAILADAASLA